MTTKIYGDYEVYALAGSGGFGTIIVVTNMYEIHNRKAYILKTLIGNFIPKKILNYYKGKSIYY